MLTFDELWELLTIQDESTDLDASIEVILRGFLVVEV